MGTPRRHIFCAFLLVFAMVHSFPSGDGKIAGAPARPAGGGGHFWTEELASWDLNIAHDEGWIPRDIAVNATGYVFVLLANNEGAGNGYVQVFSPGGSFLFQWGGPGSGPGQFAEPYGIEINATGYIYVTDDWNDLVQVFSPWGSFLYSIGSSGIGDGQFNFPTGIAINSTGYVFVSDGVWRVQVFSPSGTYLYKWEGHGSGPGMFESPYAIAINRTGHVYIFDGGNNNFQVFDSDGQFCYLLPNFAPGYMPYLSTPTCMDHTGHLILGDITNGSAVLCSMMGNLLYAFKPNISSSKFPCQVEALTVDQQDRVYTTGSVDYKVFVFSPPYAPQVPVVQGPWLGLNLYGRVDLAWAPCGGAVAYRVYRAGVPITAINSSVTLLGETTGTAWTEDRPAGE